MKHGSLEILQNNKEYKGNILGLEPVFSQASKGKTSKWFQ